MARPAKMIMIIGANRTGKTTLLKNILAMSGQRALVITPDYTEWNDKDAYGNDLYPLNELATRDDYVFSGIQRHIFNSRTLAAVKAFKKGIIVFDDCRAYLGDRTDEQIHNLMIRRGQRMVDFIAATHSFTEMPRRFFPFTSDIFLFQTKDAIDMRAGIALNVEDLKRIQAEVNAKARTNKHYYIHISYE